MQLDHETCYRAVRGRDRRFDGVFYTAVSSTGIYCRPSCPAVTPRQGNVTFYRSAAAAQGAGYRACRRCLPDATPGSPEWDVAADVADRAMRLIADGVVERHGVEGLATRLGYSSRQLGRLLRQEYGAGPLALARARRAQTARVLIETTAMSFADIAFAAGFGSIRQFNDTLREVYAASPTALRGRRAPGNTSGVLRTRVAVREPFAADYVLEFLAAHAIDAVEACGEDWYERTLRLPHGPGVVRIELGTQRRPGTVECAFTLADARDLAPAIERTRRLLDADCDPVAVAEALGDDPLLAPLVERLPGVRAVGGVDGDETACRAVLGQQVSLASARAVGARLALAHGEPLGLDGDHVVSRLFPTAGTLAGVPVEELPMPRSRGRALHVLSAALADGSIALDRSRERRELRAALIALPGIGPWTADVIAMRALGDPDVFLATDLGVRRVAEQLGATQLHDDLGTWAEQWRPWRSYALMWLWSRVVRPVKPQDAGTGPDHHEEKAG